ncbi:MAG TPA: radical SAM protein [Candidatus Omnitrophota bacterium]|nr:radical SAM protein [Candidatus Omnitrophota bacterium]HQQ06908.1 radical SAM protein [Candidatus Omnitrophota bacterium]
MIKIPLPKEILIAITYRCNAKCHMCNTWMYPSKAEAEIQPGDLLSLPEVAFCNLTGGEPFIREDLGEFVRVMRDKARRIVISTNGYYTDRIVALAKKYPELGFRVSIEGMPAVNDSLRGLKDGFDRGLRTLLELDELGRKDIGFGITLSDKNINDLMPLYQLSKRLDFEFATACVHNNFYFHKFDNAVTNTDLFRKNLTLLITDLLKSRRVKNWFRGYFNHGLLNFALGGKRLLPCEVGTDLVFIDPFGNCMPCNGMEKSMGNIRQQPFDEIWNSSRAQEARNAVAVCDKNCWMIGSVAPAMKKRMAVPAAWVMRNKLRMLLHKDIVL